jgi:hypothetical protein
MPGGRDEVARSKPLFAGISSNTMYRVAGEGFELVDVQRHTISICRYIQGDYLVEIDGAPIFSAVLQPKEI